MKNDQAMLRREVLIGLGVAAAGVSAGAAIEPLAATAHAATTDAATGPAAASGATEASAAAASPLALPARTAEVDALFGPIGPGTRVGDATIVAIHGVRHGAVPVILEQEGRRFAVEVFREEATGAPPVVRAGGLALFLVNDGTGHTPTVETNGLAVMALGRALAARRGAGAPMPAGLEPRSSRVASLASYEIPLS